MSRQYEKILKLVTIARDHLNESKEQPPLKKVLLHLLWCW